MHLNERSIKRGKVSFVLYKFVWCVVVFVTPQKVNRKENFPIKNIKVIEQTKI